MNEHEQHIHNYTQIALNYKGKISGLEMLKIFGMSILKGTSYLEEKGKFLDKRNRQWWQAMTDHIKQHRDKMNEIAGVTSVVRGIK